MNTISRYIPTKYQNLIKTQLIFLLGMQILSLILHAITLHSILDGNPDQVRYPGMNIKEI
ncbi:MAG: hypothetical protein ACK2TT_03715 [Anaerolineales bacterium]|jgi:hypothetical protein